MSAVTTVSQGETETFETQPTDAKIDQPVVENVWTKRSLEKQLAASSTSKEQNQPSADSETNQQPSVAVNDDGDDFQEVKTKKDKKDREVIAERSKDDKAKRTEKKELERKDSDKKEKKEEKKEDVVKKFDNVNYVEAPLPKTNPWAKNKSPVMRSQSSEAGMFN